MNIIMNTVAGVLVVLRMSLCQTIIYPKRSRYINWLTILFATILQASILEEILYFSANLEAYERETIKSSLSKIRNSKVSCFEFGIIFVSAALNFFFFEFFIKSNNGSLVCWILQEWDFTMSPSERAEVLLPITQVELNLSSLSGKFSIQGETYCWTAGYHLNIRLYEKLLFGVFDVLDEGQFIEVYVFLY